MRIAAAALHRFSLPLRRAWRSAGGEFSTRNGWLLRLEGEDGLVGYGECAPLPSHGTENDAQALAALQRWQATLPGHEAGEVLEALADAESFVTPAARCAVEAALLDLIARASGRSLTHCLRQCRCADEVEMNAMLGTIDDVDAAAIVTACGGGYRVLKLKVGNGDPSSLARLVRERCAALAPGITLRLDANRAWSEETARRVLDGIAGLPIESIEEPLDIPDAARLAGLQARVPFPLALDESLRDFPPQLLFEHPPVRRMVLKPASLGGFLPALTLAQRGAAAGLESVVTTVVESACGTHAALHLAATLANDLAHGLDTSRWLAEDTGAPPTRHGCMMQVPTQPGSGFVPRTDLVFS